MGALGVGLDTRIVHQQGALAAVTEERDGARRQLEDLSDRVEAVEAHVRAETLRANGLRDAVERRDVQLEQSEGERKSLTVELEAQRLAAEASRQMKETDRARFNDETSRLRNQLEASRKSAEEARDRLLAELQTERDRAAAAEDAALLRGYEEGQQACEDQVENISQKLFRSGWIAAKVSYGCEDSKAGIDEIPSFDD